MLSMEILKRTTRLKQDHKVSCKRQLRSRGVLEWQRDATWSVNLSGYSWCKKVDELQITQNEALKDLTTVKQSMSAEKQKQAKQQRPYCIYHKNNTHTMDDSKALAYHPQQQQCVRHAKA
uniref:Uncharacterized protein n=1 Tax=Romanomermis culicivorax TaxID=13658 RepID=A0A915K7J8_ROMCU